MKGNINLPCKKEVIGYEEIGCDSHMHHLRLYPELENSDNAALRLSALGTCRTGFH